MENNPDRIVHDWTASAGDRQLEQVALPALQLFVEVVRKLIIINGYSILKEEEGGKRKVLLAEGIYANPTEVRGGMYVPDRLDLTNSALPVEIKKSTNGGIVELRLRLMNHFFVVRLQRDFPVRAFTEIDLRMVAALLPLATRLIIAKRQQSLTATVTRAGQQSAANQLKAISIAVGELGNDNDQIVNILKCNGYLAVSFDNMKSIVNHVSSNKTDLMIINGGDTISELKKFVNDILQKSYWPLIVLSKSNLADEKIEFLELGVEDYLVKPISSRELLARVRGLLRRCSMPLATPAVIASFGDGQNLGDWRIDGERCIVVGPGGRTCRLSPTEFALIGQLRKNEDRVLSRSKLLQLTRGSQAAVNERLIDNQIGRLKRKLIAAGAPGELISSVRGGGYMLQSSVRSSADGSPPNVT